MLKNGMDKMSLQTSKYVPTPKKCLNKLCGVTLKNTKKYILTRIVERRSGFWTVGKQCKKCGFESVASTGDD